MEGLLLDMAGSLVGKNRMQKPDAVRICGSGPVFQGDCTFARAQQAQVGSQQQAALLGGLATMGASFLTPKKIDPSLKQGTF